MNQLVKVVRTYGPTWVGIALVAAGVVMALVGPKNQPWGALALGVGVVLLG
jgi:fructose-1,6-bisphosphatase/inositol monophosphatase family enzyme